MATPTKARRARHARRRAPSSRASRGGVRAGRYAYVSLLGLSARHFPGVLDRLQKGVPFSAVERFQGHTALSLRQVATLISVPERTLLRRRQTGRLRPDEADRLLRASRLFAQALGLFEDDAEAARAWFSKPQPALGGARPLDVARTEVGAREVENLIGRLEHGIPS